MLTPAQVQLLRDGPRENRVRRAKELAGTTQTEIARHVGVSQPYVAAIEADDYAKMPLETARKLARFFGCEIEVLFPGPAPADTAAVGAQP